MLCVLFVNAVKFRPFDESESTTLVVFICIVAFPIK